MKRKMGFLLACQFLCQPVFVSAHGKGACLSGSMVALLLVLMGVSCRAGDSCIKKEGSGLNFFFSWHFQETDTIGVDVVIYYISIYWHNKLQQFLYQRILESPDGTGSIFLV